MNWIKYAAFAITGLVAVPLIVLVFLGGLRGEARHVVSVDIARPPAAVFEAVRRTKPGAPSHVQPPTALEWEIAIPSEYSGTLRYELEDMEARGTRLTCRETRHYERFRDRLLEPILSRSVQQRLEADVRQLKDTLEAR